MNKIMFVCHGNICRSPMAEVIMKALIKKKGMEKRFQIDSSATSTEEILNGFGNPVYPAAKAELSKHGLTCEYKRAIQLKKADYPLYDYFVCMDSANIKNCLLIFGSDPDNKVVKLLSFTGCSRDVADPWYTNQFDVTYRDILEGCQALLKSLT